MINHKIITLISPMCKNNKLIDWCNDELKFDLIYDIDGYMFLYKKTDFWMYTDKEGIRSRKFNHFDYWNFNVFELISVMKINKEFVIFFKNKIEIYNCNKTVNIFDYKTGGIDNTIDGVFYNHTADILYLFSKETPKSYFKVINMTGKYPKLTVKPISLWKLDTFDYDLVFSRNNNVYFINNDEVDYYDFSLGISVRNVEFKDLFLSGQCGISPLIKREAIV